jgi:hypothetical protein
MRVLTRRDFLHASLAGASSLVLARRADAILVDPYAPGAVRSGVPVRVRGRVHSGGRGLARVRVTDGQSVVTTDAEGRYTLLSDDAREYVYVTVPAGYDIPQNATGTARFYERLSARSGEASASFELRRALQDDRRHATLFLADVQTQDEQELRWFHEQTVPDVIDTVRRLSVPAVGVAVGDIMYDHLELYPEYERGVHRMRIPFFQVIGNHDLDQESPTDEGSAVSFSRHFGPRYYSFDRGTVHYVVLDDVFWHGAGYIGYLGTEQLSWLARDLAYVERGRTVLLTLHIPVLGSRHEREGARTPGVNVSVTNREALYRLLEPYRAHIVSGHTHESDHVLEHGVHEHVLGTVCGAWWSGPICHDGTPNGYAVFEVDGETVRWRYRATSHPDDHQMRVYAPGTEQAAPAELVANVWDWDPAWTVVWYADGERRGAMTRRVARDPLSIELHTGPELPPRRTWVDPVLTRHLFYAPAAPGVREYRVEATDGFGRVYTTAVSARPADLSAIPPNSEV